MHIYRSVLLLLRIAVDTEAAGRNSAAATAKTERNPFVVMFRLPVSACDGSGEKRDDVGEPSQA